MATETEPKAYGVAMDNYEQLVNTIPVEEVLQKLLTKRVINFSDKQIIMSEKSDVNRAECLLENHIMNQLIAEEDGPFLALLDAMRESGKCDNLVKKIYQKLGMEMPQKGDSYEIIEKVLSNKRVFLTQNLSSDDLVDYLVQERMIDDSIRLKLRMHCFTPMEKNRWIIDSLVTGPPDTFKRFCAILRKVKKYNYIAEELERDQLKQLYYQAKHDLGSEVLHLLKVLIFGPPGAGKSSLLKVLLGGDPDPVRHSTGVCDRKLVQCTIAVTVTGNTSQSVWKELYLENEVQRLQSKIMEKLANKPMALTDTVHHSSHLQIEGDFFRPSTEPTNQHSTVINQNQFDIKHTSALIACYDSGGQPEFFDVMPALTTIPTGYVMVFDMSKSLLTKNVEFYREGKKCPVGNTAHYTNAELMKTALANIWSSPSSVCTEKVSSRLSRFGQLLVVGTHLDKCGSTSEEQDDKVVKIEKILAKDIINIPQTSTLKIVERKNKSLVHPISNILKKNRAEAAQEIRTAIENMSECEKTSKDIPINWLLFQLEIRRNEKHYITHSRCIDIAIKCYIKEEDVDTILMFFHELGVLLHYRNIPALRHVVFCSPQWLFDKLTKLIEVKYDPPHDIAKHKKIKIGTFDKEFLNAMYTEDFISNDVFNYEHLCELFVSLNIMAVLPGEIDKYFMPALLNPAPEMIDVSIYGKKIYDTLIVKFENGYIPRGVFCCLVVECMRKAIGWSVLHGEAAYKNLIIFQISTDLDLYVFLQDKIDSITLSMFHKSKSPLQMSPDALCSTINESIISVCKQLKINNNFSLGFSCKHSSCNGFSYVQHQPLLQEISVCDRCNHRSKLQNDQMIWFSSLTQKVPSQEGHSALSISQLTAAVDKDKEVFRSNYYKFCNSMTDIENILKYFVTVNIINTDDQSEILAPPRLTSKVTLLLTHISGPLEAGDTKPFRLMLDIMEKHGNLATKALAISVKRYLMTKTGDFDESYVTSTEQEPVVATKPVAVNISNLPILDKPVSMGTVVKVAPAVATDWEDIGYRLWLEDEDMGSIEGDVSRTGDTRLAYKKVMKTWIKSTRGRKPKTWRTFLMVLQELGINVNPVVALLQEEPVAM